MTINGRVSKLEKAMQASGQYVNVWGCAVPKVELETETGRIKTLIKIARGFIPKAAPERLNNAPEYLDVYPIPGYLTTICNRAKSFQFKEAQHDEA